jgi:cell division protein FtsB
MTARVRKRGRITPRAALLALVVVGVLLYGAVPFKAYLAQRSTLEQVQRQTNALEQQNAALRVRVKQLRDPEYVEKLARCEGMVRPGEISFVIVPKDGDAEPSAC